MIQVIAAVEGNRGLRPLEIGGGSGFDSIYLTSGDLLLSLGVVCHRPAKDDQCLVLRDVVLRRGLRVVTARVVLLLGASLLWVIEKESPHELVVP
jgi:hypothetical protein